MTTPFQNEQITLKVEFLCTSILHAFKYEMCLAKQITRRNVLGYYGKGELEYRATTKRVCPIKVFTTVFIKTLTNLPFCVMELWTETECQETEKVTHRRTPGVKTKNFLSS